MMLRESWNQLWQRLTACGAPVDVFDELLTLYSGSDRFYHNLWHIKDCLEIFELAEYSSVHKDEVKLAIWFHDAIYDTKGSGNEQKSAAWADSVIGQAGVDKDVADTVSHLILATCHTAEVTGIDEQIIVDVDLSIFGAEEEVFWQYEENIRKEYAWVPETIFASKRVQILRSFLSREYIYHLCVYRTLFEQKARENLSSAIFKLEGA